MRKFSQRYAVIFCILFLLQEVRYLVAIPNVENGSKDFDRHRFRKDAHQESDNIKREDTGVAVHNRKKRKLYRHLALNGCHYGVFSITPSRG